MLQEETLTPSGIIVDIYSTLVAPEGSDDLTARMFTYRAVLRGCRNMITSCDTALDALLDFDLANEKGQSTFWNFNNFKRRTRASFR